MLCTLYAKLYYKFMSLHFDNSLSRLIKIKNLNLISKVKESVSISISFLHQGTEGGSSSKSVTVYHHLLINDDVFLSSYLQKPLTELLLALQITVHTKNHISFETTFLFTKNILS